MPPRKNNSPSKPTSSRVLLGMEGKQRGGGTNQRIQASRPSNKLNSQRTQIVAAPALSALKTSIVSHSWNPLRPLQRPIVFVPGVHTRILFSCDHEDEGKRAKDDVNEEVVHGENVDALDMGMGWEVEGDPGWDSEEETVATHTLAIGSLELSFKDIHIRSEPPEETFHSSEDSGTMSPSEDNQVAQPTTAVVPPVLNTIPIATQMYAEQGIVEAPMIQRALPTESSPSPALTTTPNRDAAYMANILQALRKFVQNPGSGGKQKLSLPKPSSKETHKHVYELAGAFHLTGAKKKKNSGAQLVFMGSTKTLKARPVDEKKVAKIMKKFGLPATVTHKVETKPKHVDSVGRMAPNPRVNGKMKGSGHREGDTIGKAAPKINASNVGFKMLETMGWSEGEKIGSGGLEAPIDAVMKRSKLGLGA